MRQRNKRVLNFTRNIYYMLPKNIKKTHTITSRAISNVSKAVEVFMRKTHRVSRLILISMLSYYLRSINCKIPNKYCKRQGLR